MWVKYSLILERSIMSVSKISFLCSLFLVLFSPQVLLGQNDSPYEREYSVMNYGSAQLRDAVTALQARMNAGEVSLEFNAERGYLDAALDALGISSTSQLLVFSRTSLQQPLISPQSPRAIYFNDYTYVIMKLDTEL